MVNARTQGCPSYVPLLVVWVVAALAGSAAAATPTISAPTYVVSSSIDGRTLAAREADTSRPMASITKLMTVLVARDRARLDEQTVVTAQATQVGESTLALRAGELISVRDLIVGALVPSANDAATALALHVGRGSLRRFVRLMNVRARALGMTGTHYRNPHGLDEPGHVSTARDSIRLLRAALRDPVIRRFAAKPTAMLSDGRTVESTDHLIGVVAGFLGGKTGHTSAAGWSQVAAARREGVTISAAVLGVASEAQRDADIAALIEWGLASYRRSRVVDPQRTYARVEVGWGLESLRLIAPRAVVRVAPTGRALRERVVAPFVVALPVRQGQRLGELVVRDAGRIVARSPLVADRAIAAPGRIEQARFVARRSVHHLVGLVR